MSNPSEVRADRHWWDDTCNRQGHTGWADAQVYAYDQPLRRRTIQQLLRKAFAHGLQGQQAIDVGCGTGDFASVLCDLGAQVLAFDFSPAVLERARLRFRGNERIQLQCASVTEIPAADASAVAITCITVLQHLVVAEDVQRALHELRRVLRPEGMVVILELAPSLDDSNVSADGHVIQRPVRTWRTALQAAGLRIESEEVYPQVGITALRLLANAIDRLRGNAHATAASDTSQHNTPLPVARRVLRGGLAVIRGLLLAAAWPIDRFFCLQLPERHRYYRLWILRTS